MRKISISEIVVVTKDSKVNYDRKRRGETEAQVLKFYKDSDYTATKIDSIFASHKIQQAGRKYLINLLSRKQVLDREQFLGNREFRAAGLIIPYGGDNHFQYVARNVTGQLMAGINADPARSDGQLTPFVIEALPNLLTKLQVGDYSTKEWTRFQVKVNGKLLPYPVLCEVFLGEHMVECMSRLVVRFKGEEVRHKGSGLLVYTGAGSTGWGHSIDHHPFEISDKRVRFVMMNNYTGRISAKPKHTKGFIRIGNEFTITSLNDSEGVLVLDALDSFPFPEGSIATIEKASPLTTIFSQ